MYWARLCIGAALAWGVAAAAAANAAAPTTGAVDPGLGAKLESLLRALDDDDFRVRQRATLELEQLPAEAVGPLERAIAGGELTPEVVTRIESRISLLRRKQAATPGLQERERATAFARDGMLRAYDEGGYTDPRWDAAARQAIRLAFRPGNARNWTAHDTARARAALHEAIALGCDDPVVQYYDARLALEQGAVTPAGAAARLKPVAERLGASKAPDWCKVVVFTELARACELAKVEDPSERNVVVGYDATVQVATLLPKATTVADFPATLRLELAQAACSLDRDANHLDRNAYQRTQAGLAKALGKDSAWPRVYRAWHDLVTLNETRRWAGEAGYRTQLEGARKDLEAAWSAATAEGSRDAAAARAAATEMLRSFAADAEVAHGDVELWFKRATDNQAPDYDACSYVLRYLLLRDDAGHGLSLGFAREQRATNDFQSRLPFILVDAHLLIGLFQPSHRSNAYLADSGVWAEVREVYEQYLQRYPAAARDRSDYANLAARTGHYADARRQLEILGEGVEYGRFNGKTDFDYLKRKVFNNR